MGFDSSHTRGANAGNAFPLACSRFESSLTLVGVLALPLERFLGIRSLVTQAIRYLATEPVEANPLDQGIVFPA